MLTEKELKLIRLALDPGAADGEWNNAAIMFFRCARARLISPEQFERLGNGAGPIYAVPPTQPDYGLTAMPWGKHKGELFKDISPSYLAFAYDWIMEDPDRKAKMKNLADAIRAFLNL